ncbi:MAG: inositol monophosphatase family protein [Casimicrobium sp.]
MNERLQLALDLAAEASVEIATAFARRTHATAEKSANDFATETDASVEAHIERRIAALFPGDVLIGEEGGERLPQPGNEASGYRWIVDPLDGTFNFIHGFPYIATSIAVELGGTIEIGVIANPITDEVFYAERGGGAWLVSDDATPQRLQVSGCDALASALVASVLPSGASASFARVLPAWTDVARSCASIRRTGAAALDLAHLAAGRLDGFFVMSLAAWDAAAGSLIVTEAGGHICDFRGGNDYLRTNEVIAGTRGVCDDLVRVLAHHARDVSR